VPRRRGFNATPQAWRVFLLKLEACRVVEVSMPLRRHGKSHIRYTRMRISRASRCQCHPASKKRASASRRPACRTVEVLMPLRRQGELGRPPGIPHGTAVEVSMPLRRQGLTGRVKSKLLGHSAGTESRLRRGHHMALGVEATMPPRKHGEGEEWSIAAACVEATTPPRRHGERR